MPTINIPITVTDEGTFGFLDVVIDSAAILYWCENIEQTYTHYKFSTTEPHEVRWCTGFTLTTEDPHSQQGGTITVVVDHALVWEGARRIATGECKVADYLVDHIFRNFTNDTLGECDQEECDVILQAAIFNELIYG